MISKEQIAEWAENQTTLELKKLAQKQLTSILNTPPLDCIAYGEPNKTHENVVELETRARAWLDLVTALNGDWSYFEEIGEDDEFYV